MITYSPILRTWVSTCRMDGFICLIMKEITVSKDPETGDYSVFTYSVKTFAYQGYSSEDN